MDYLQRLTCVTALRNWKTNSVPNPLHFELKWEKGAGKMRSICLSHLSPKCLLFLAVIFLEMLIVGAGDVSGALNMLIQVLKKNHSRNKKIVLETVVSCSKSSGLCEECRTAPLSTWHHSGQGPVSGFLLMPVCWLPKPASAGVMRMYQAKQAFPPLRHRGANTATAIQLVTRMRN